MKVHVNTAGAIHAHQAFLDQVADRVEHTIDRFGDSVTRVDVHLSDESGRRVTASTTRCVIEAHLAGHEPVVLTHRAATAERAVSEAVEKLQGAVARSLARLGVR